MQQIKPAEEPVSVPQAPAVSKFYYGWVVVAVCFVVIALNSPLLSSFSVFLPAILREFNWSRGSASIALALHLVMSGLMGPFAGGFIDRYGPKQVMPLGAVVTAAALLWLSQSASLWQFYLAFGVLAAIGSAMIHIVPLTAIVSNWFVRNRGTAVGIVAAGSGLGQLVLMPLLKVLIERFGWRAAYIMLGLAILLIPTALIRLFLHSRPEDRGLTAEAELIPRRKRKPVEVVIEAEGEVIARKRGALRRNEVLILDPEWAEREWTVGKAVGTFRFWAITLMMAMFAAGFFIISVHLVTFLEDHHYGPLLAASVVGLQGFINILGKACGGFLCDRMGREKTLTLSVIVFIACVALLSLGGLVKSPAIIYAFAVLYGMGYGMALPALIASAGDLFGGKHFGSILGVILLGGFIGGALGTWLGGKLFDLTRGYGANFIIAVVTMLISAALIWSARPSRVRLVRSVSES